MWYECNGRKIRVPQVLVFAALLGLFMTWNVFMVMIGYDAGEYHTMLTLIEAFSQ